MEYQQEVLRSGWAPGPPMSVNSGSFNGSLNLSASDLLRAPGRKPERQQDQLASLVHDARNMVTALYLYCDLLDEAGVLGAGFSHYADELRMVAVGSRRLLEKIGVVATFSGAEQQLSGAAIPRSPDTDMSLTDLNLSDLTASDWTSSARNPSRSGPGSGREVADIAPDGRDVSQSSIPGDSLEGRSARRLERRRVLWAGQPIESFADEVLGNQNLLSALAGPGIKVEVSISGGGRAIAMTGEDLTRILVNLVRNSAEAMSSGGLIEIFLEPGTEASSCGSLEWLRLTVRDSGPGFPAGELSEIFDAGYSSSRNVREPGPDSMDARWPAQRKGLGLSIVRSIVLAAGGSVSASNRLSPQTQDSARVSGAEIVMEFPAVS